MTVTIIAHSVCGNTWLMATAFADAFAARGAEVVLRRVADPAWVLKPEAPPAARDLLLSMRAVPEAVPADLERADLVMMGSPVYFGNVSAQVKAFQDLTGGLWVRGRLAGKRFAAFVSAGNPQGGGDLTLQALHTYARYMGMACLPLPVTVLPGENLSSLGIIQFSAGAYAPPALDVRTASAIVNWVPFLEGNAK